MLIELENWGCNVKEALERFVDDEELYVTCMNLFIADTFFETLGETIKSQKYTEAFEAAHTLKGVAGNLSAEPIYTIIDSLTERLRQKDSANLEEDYKKILELRDSLKAILGA